MKMYEYGYSKIKKTRKSNNTCIYFVFKTDNIYKILIILQIIYAQDDIGATDF